MNKEDTIMIVFIDGKVRYVDDVDNYGINDRGVFFYTKNRKNSFVPIENVKYFGAKDNWTN